MRPLSRLSLLRTQIPRLLAVAAASAIALHASANTPLPAPAGDPIAAQIQANELVESKKFAEAVELLEPLANGNPSSGEIWSSLGYALHMAKRYNDAIPAFARAVELGINPAGNLYNIACAHALLGQPDAALAALEKAFNARYADQGELERDTDLDSLRGDLRFANLTGSLMGLATPVAASRDDGWRWDLDFMQRRMKQMHWSLYAKVSEHVFHAEIEKLKSEIPNLTDDQARLRVRRIVAMVGDGHTAVAYVPVGATTQPMLPIHMFRFAEGLYIIGAASDHADLVGARIEKIGGLSADDAMNAVKPYLSVDNAMGYLSQGPTILLRPQVLQAIGATKDASGVELTISSAGSAPRTVRVAFADRPAERYPGFILPGFKYAHESAPGEPPLIFRNPAELLRIDTDEAHKLVYFRFGAVQNTPTLSFGNAVKQVFDTIAKIHAKYLVIDMRFNGGGNTDITPPLIRRLIADGNVNVPGHLYVITGRHTYSAAQNVVNQLDGHTNAIFVGEPTGSKPNFVGESTSFVLPHSKTRVYCSSRYWQFFSSLDERTWVAPSLAAPMTFEAYSHNQDPCMDAILSHIKYREENVEHATPRP